ncbi:MAG: alpha/beta hydrolase [Ilumatobacteraceae bacterium]
MSGAIWSEEAGPEGAPLIALVHGSMDRSAGLLKLSRRLADDHRVLRYDRRGYGRSAPHPGPFGMDGQVADLVALLDGRPAVVFGHSYGGNVALAVAAGRPDLVRAVGVYESPLSWFDWWPRTTAGSGAVAEEGDPADVAERFMRRMIGDGRWEHLPPGSRAARRTEGAAMVGELTDLSAHAPWSPDAIRVPALAIHGSLGAAHHGLSTAYLGHVLADVEVVEIDGAKHFGPNTHPDAVAAEIRGLITRADESGS